METSKSPKPAKRIASFTELCSEVAAHKHVAFTLPQSEEPIEVVIRPLSTAELASANSIIHAVIPPMKDKVTKSNGREEVTKVYDEEDPEYLKKCRDASRQRRAVMITKGLVEPKIEFSGEDPASLSAKLESMLSESMLTFLQQQIGALSSGDIEVFNLGNFTSSAG